jgi:hypothetical protein
MNQEYDKLFHGFLDSTLNQGELVRLNKILKESPAAADQFAEIALLHGSLHSGFRSGALATKHTHAVANIPGRKPILSSSKTLLPWAMAAAAAVVAIVALRDPETGIITSPVAEVEKHNSGFAILTHSVNSIWSGTTPAEGDLLPQGLLELKSGLAQIEFFSGVSLVLEGDAALEIISPDEMRLLRGKLRAHVPRPAIGFKIHTPQGTALDLGTEFALDVSHNDSELHVIDGEVEWHEESEPDILLTKGQALQLTGKENSRIEAKPERFTGPDQLARKIADYQTDRFTDWQQDSRATESHPELLAYFPMDQLQDWDRELPSKAGKILPGAIVGAKVVEGRWPQKEALDFSPNGSRVRIHIPGRHQALTYSTWAKIDSLDRQYNALFLTDNYGLGEPHWQIREDGRLFFSVGLGKGKLHHIFHSPVIWDYTKSEQWLHLVTTYDVGTRTCVHYLNGEEISRESAPEEKGVGALVIGNAQIGNWGLPTREEPEFAVRNLNGRLDEFTIYQSALTPEEIKSLYLSGKP